MLYGRFYERIKPREHIKAFKALRKGGSRGGASPHVRRMIFAACDASRRTGVIDEATD